MWFHPFSDGCAVNGLYSFLSKTLKQRIPDLRRKALKE